MGGTVLAHFDDDDLYTPEYLSHMLAQLLDTEQQSEQQQGCESVGAGELGAALVTLSQWHLIDIQNQSFGFFDPKTEPLLDDLMRNAIMYGYGFTYVYTKKAWESVP